MRVSIFLLSALPFATTAFASTFNSTVEKRQLASVITSCTQPNTVALTFDDGPWDFIYDLGNLIHGAGGKATFFFNGNNWDCIYNRADAIRYVYNQGHQLASHTWAHDDLTTKNQDQLHDTFWKVEQALQRIAGVTPAFMRPPFGNYNDLVRQVAAARGQSVVIWDFDSHDGDDNPPPDWQLRSEYGHLLWDLRPNNVLALNHEFNHDTAYNVMWQVVEWCNQLGYKMVTVAECLGQQPYQNVGNPENGNWQC
ncbi:glycoside hydrolase/deacetylase [Marasmius fiardii PR-910]|nr:glycoside hydrolase/deacetylase [Marasmius fiardii PR-910]